MSAAFDLADMRACVEERGGLLMPEESLALIEVAEAASEAAILTYDPVKSVAQNNAYQRRAQRLNEALAKLGFGPRA